MSLNLNKVMLAGRLTTDPELKTTQSGVSVTSFQIAVNRPTKKGDEQIADFITVIAWKERAEFVSRYFRKGSSIFVEGALRQRKFQDKSGVNRSVIEVLADEIQFVESKKNSENSDQQGPYETSSTDFQDVTENEDLPF